MRRWFRWRLRTLVVSVALAALALATPIEVRRRTTRRYRTYHAHQARVLRDGVAGLKRDAEAFRRPRSAARRRPMTGSSSRGRR